MNSENILIFSDIIYNIDTKYLSILCIYIYIKDGL